MPGSGSPGWLYPGQYGLGASVNEVAVPAIAATTTLYTPALQLAEISVPFISAATSVFAPSVTGGVFPPFIDSVTQLFQCGLQITGAQPVRISQTPAEAILLPTSGKARVSGVAVEVLMRATAETVSVVIID